MMPVLIVDDSLADAALASRVFAQCRVLNPVRFMVSGTECLEYFEYMGQRTEKTLPCVVFLDLAMQPVSGIDVLRRLQNHAKAEGSVFVMLSGLTDYKIIREGYQLGAATFLIKPLRPDDVLRTVKSLKGITIRTTSDGHILFPTAGTAGQAPSTSHSRADNQLGRSE